MNQLNNTFKIFGTYQKKLQRPRILLRIYIIHVPNIKNTFNKSIYFFNEIINNISIDYNKVDPHADSDDNKSGSDGTGIELLTPDGPQPPQKDSHQTSSETSHNSLLPSSMEQTKTSQSSQDSSEKGSSGQSYQERPQKPVPTSVIKHENSGTEIKGNETPKIDDIYVLK
ncbi:hypothetical protein PCHDK_000490500 [Plasmodium chabaudi adami]|uniref:Uncharacterized protein n=1 Tax=Plasmodium chabaudi adami TaxID=5826 RepID=A0A1D3L6R7_PLACE|nr:hypothetical protein PCHDK_000490500 [Plasmodium chabaudi adami]